MRYSKKAFSIIFVAGLMGIGLIKKILTVDGKEPCFFSDESIPSDEDDERFVKDLNQLDSYILRRANCDEYESLFISERERCSELFRRWLAAKGVEKDTEVLIGFPEIFYDFVYSCPNEEIFLLNLYAPDYLEIFFTDFILRKLTIEPRKYAYAPASIKLFYVFLWEKGYLGDPKPFMAAIDSIKPRFNEILEKRFVDK